MPKPAWFGEAEGMQERRSAARHSVYLGAQFRGRGKSAAPVTLLDLSMLGCRIEQSYLLQEGSYGWLKLDGLEAIYSKVAWRRDTFVGLEFDVPLHERVVERLVASSATLTPSASELSAIAMRTRALARNEDSLSIALELLTLATARACVLPRTKPSRRSDEV
jgi:hypothetical protein